MTNRRYNKLGLANGFTLVELLVALAIVGLLTSIVLVAMAGVTENARTDRTRSQIARIHSLIAAEWEKFEDVRVEVSLFSARNPMYRARHIVDAKRELMRMSFPERITDVADGLFIDLHPQFRRSQLGTRPFMYAGLTSEPAIWHAYRRKAQQMTSVKNPKAMWWEAWTQQNQGAECLYLIISQLRDGDRSALEFFRENEIADTDNDGMLELVDAWGTPIVFYRWAPGFNVDPQYRSQISGANDPLSAPYPSEVAGGFQNVDTPDPLDPLSLYSRWPTGIPNRYQVQVAIDQSQRTGHRTFMLFPVIMSAGPDKALDFNNRIGAAGNTQPVRYAMMTPPNNPYIGTFDYQDQSDLTVGIRADTNQNLKDDFADNIHNHLIQTGR